MYLLTADISHYNFIDYKQQLDEVFVISRVTKVEVSVISRGRSPRLIALASTLIILDITKTEFNYCFIIHCFMENIQKLFCEMQVDFICACKNTRTNTPSGRIT